MEALLLLVTTFILAPLLMHLLGLELTPKKKNLPCGASPAALDALRKCEPQAGVFFNAVDAPEWLRWLFVDREYRRLLLREWEDVEWRDRSGWKGRDLIHHPSGKAVVVHAYFWKEQDRTLEGIVSFGPEAESHRGLCHGGAMTSLMDDLCGHICFVGGAGPWCGATVQVNCSLKKPVRVGDVLKVVGQITSIERKKVKITAQLLGEDGSVYAELDGLSISPVAMGDFADAIQDRKWMEQHKGADRFMLDTGWQLP